MSDDDKVARILDTSTSRPMIPNRTLDPRTSGAIAEMAHTTIGEVERNANIGRRGMLPAFVCYELPPGVNDGSFLDWAGSFFGADAPDLVSAVVYVPMIHSSKGDPWTHAARQGIEVNQTDAAWRSLVDTLLPDSSAKVTADSSAGIRVGELTPGAKVWVRYVDSVNAKNGVLLGAVSVKADEALESALPPSTRAVHAGSLPIALTGPPGALDTVLETFQSRGTTVTLLKGGPFTENRVRRNTFGALPSNSPLLVPIPSVGTTRKVHTLAAKRLAVMNRAWVAANPSKPPFKAASGWRPHRWKSRKQYVDTMNVRYGSLREGRKWVAYASPHETGLAVDFGNNGLTPKKAQISRMLREPAYRWLQQNAYKYGFSPYKNEPWHWEVQMPRDNWNSGDEFTSDLSVYVEEKSNETQRLTRNVIFAKEVFA